MLAAASIALAVLSGAPAQARSPSPPSAAQRVVQRWLGSGALHGTDAGVAVIDADSGEVLASHQADRLLYLASVTKLLTTAAALRLLPEGIRFTTRAQGKVSAGRVSGPLRLVGGGDPKLLPPHLTQLAKDLFAAGVREIPDGVVVDTSFFGGDALPPGFAIKNTDAGYRASTGAAAVNFGAVRVLARGGRVGAPPRVTVQPASDAVVVDNRARTVGGKRKALQVVARALADGRTRLTVTGSLGRRARYNKRKRVASPDLMAGHLLVKALRGLGVDVRGGVRLSTEPTPADVPVLARVVGQDLQQTITDINVYSNNFMAETLFRHLGRGPGASSGGWKRAQERLATALAELGVQRRGVTLVNGSGLYRASRATAGAIARLLQRMATAPEGPRFARSMPVAGVSGTLRKRLRGEATRGRVKGKTGTLDEVVSLAAYVPTAGGRRLAVAIVINEAKATTTGRLRATIDTLVTRLARLP